MQRRHWLLSAGRMAAASIALPSATLGLQACRDGHGLGGLGEPDGVAGGFVGPDMARGHAWRERVQSGHWPAPAVQHRCKVVIAGGGMAGLAAARALRLAGESDFALLELEDAAGGNSRGHTLQGQPCPLGAHYLPVPSNDAPEVQDWLEELGLRQRVAGRWQYDERHLCHSPQERLFLHGAWQEGVLPHDGVPASTLAQYQRMAQLVRQLQQQAPFTMPAWRGWQHGQPLHALHAELDAQTLASWLAQHGLDDAYLHWFLNYCCRDDYGAGIHTVSAWAGLHYFASRGGFHAPKDEASSDGAAEAESDGVLTWPDGNGWLVRQLADPLLAQSQLHRGQAVLRIATEKHGVAVDVWSVPAQRVERWWCERCVVALPTFIAQRVLQPEVPAVKALASTLRQAPWLVSNLHLNGPLAETSDMPLAWDSVVFDDPNPGALGYVHAGHQRLDAQTPQPTVLTYYQALGDVPNARRLLAETPWTHWRDAAVQSVRRMHPDLDARLTEVSVTRHGHAMAVPEVGRLQLVHRLATQAAPLRAVVAGEALRVAPVVHAGRLAFAHADWAAYSVLEEAFTRGHHAGAWAAAASL